MQAQAKSKAEIIFFMLMIALTGWFALCLQFYLAFPLYLSKGMTVFEAILRFFSYFTILTNILVALSLTLSLVAPLSKPGIFFSKPKTKSAIALYIGIVGLIYSLVLRQLWSPQGLQWLTDVLLHDAIPLLYMIYWLFFVGKGTLRWSDAFTWLIYPIAYLPWILIIGLIIKLYPYPFVDVTMLDYPRVLLNALLFALGFLAGGWLLICVDRILNKKKNNML